MIYPSQGRSRSERLSPEEEKGLALRWRNEGDLKARDRIVRAHFDLVRGVIGRLRSKARSPEDLFQDGVLGLMRALDRFDPESGNRFSTYAVFWVRAEIQNALGQTSGLIRVPRSEKTQKVIAWYQQTRARVEAEVALGLIPLPTDGVEREAARRIGLCPDQIRGLLTLTLLQEIPVETHPSSEDPGDERPGRVLYTEVTPETELYGDQSRTLFRKLVEEGLSELKPREREVLERRHLLDEPETLQVIAEDFGLTRERIRQIEVRALDKLRRRLKANRTLRDTLASQTDGRI
jgi:RNA polymerase sigma-32 factor